MGNFCSLHSVHPLDGRVDALLHPSTTDWWTHLNENIPILVILVIILVMIKVIIITILVTIKVINLNESEIWCCAHILCLPHHIHSFIESEIIAHFCYFDLSFAFLIGYFWTLCTFCVFVLVCVRTLCTFCVFVLVCVRTSLLCIVCLYFCVRTYYQMYIPFVWKNEGDLLWTIWNLSPPSLPVARHYLEPVRIAHLGFIQWSFQKTGPTSTTRLPSHRCCTYLPYPIDLHLKLGGGLENLWKFIHRQQ